MSVEFSRDDLESECSKLGNEIDFLIKFYKDLNSQLSNLKSQIVLDNSNLDQIDKTNSDLIDKIIMTFEQLEKRFEDKANQMTDQSGILFKGIFNIKLLMNDAHHHSFKLQMF